MKTPRPAQRPLRPRDNSYRAEDILAEFGTLAQFMAVAGPKAPLAIPDLGFTAAENKRMDQLIAEERAAADTL